jgi:hypothetical protein
MEQVTENRVSSVALNERHKREILYFQSMVNFPAGRRGFESRLPLQFNQSFTAKQARKRRQWAMLIEVSAAQSPCQTPQMPAARLRGKPDAQLGAIGADVNVNIRILVARSDKASRLYRQQGSNTRCVTSYGPIIGSG